MAITNVLFDVGETLLHARPSFPGLFAATLRGAGASVEEDAVHREFGVIGDLFAAAAAEGDLWTTSDEDSRRFWFGAYGVVLDALGVEADDDLLGRLYATFTDVRNYGLFDDVVPTLHALESAGVPMGIVSNFEAWLEDLLEHVGLSSRFPVRVISGKVGLEKPDPRIFELALAAMGARPEQTAYVGDNPLFDAGPASAMGMLGVVIDRHDRHPDTPHVRITSLEDLADAIGLG